MRAIRPTSFRRRTLSTDTRAIPVSGLGPLLEEAYSAAAEKLARNAFRGGDARGLVPCKPASPADAVCRAKFLRTFGLRAFRRPMLETEIARYSKLLASEAAAQRDFYKGAQLALEAMLQSPEFLFRLENTAEPKWRPYRSCEPPLVCHLGQHARSDAVPRRRCGDLNTREAVEKAARRMLDDPKARRVSSTSSPPSGCASIAS